MRYYKIILIIIIVLMFSNCNSKSENSKKSASSHNGVVLNLKYNSNNIDDIERIISIIVKEKRYGNQASEELLSNVTSKIILDLNRLQKKGIDEKRVIKNYLVLYQYIEVYNQEMLDEICRNLFIKRPELVVECLIDVQNYLLEEFKNDEFLRSLYKSICDLPNKYYDTGQQKSMKKIMLRKLLLIRNNKNANILDYVVKENFSCN